jgi:hypothetical protein
MSFTPVLRAGFLLGAMLASTRCGRVPDGVQGTLSQGEARQRAELVLDATVLDKHADRELLRDTAGIAGVDALPVRWMEYRLDVTASEPAGTRGRIDARLAHTGGDLWRSAGEDLQVGAARRFYAVRSGGDLWIVGWDDGTYETAPPSRGPPAQWTGTRFFPPGALSADRWRDDFLHRWYARELAALGEPPLYTRAGEAGAHVYRFLWLRSFHPSIVVRLEVHPDGRGTIVFRERGFQGRDVDQAWQRNLDATATRTFMDALARADFWSMTEEPGVGCDGAEWVLEGVAGSRYHAASRWSPTEGAYRDAMLLLVSLAGARVNEVF